MRAESCTLLFSSPSPSLSFLSLSWNPPSSGPRRRQRCFDPAHRSHFDSSNYHHHCLSSCLLLLSTVIITLDVFTTHITKSFQLVFVAATNIVFATQLVLPNQQLASKIQRQGEREREASVNQDHTPG